MEWPKDGVREVEWKWTIDCTLIFDNEPVICDPFCGSALPFLLCRVICCLVSRVPQDSATVLCVFRYVSTRAVRASKSPNVQDIRRVRYSGFGATGVSHLRPIEV